MHRVDVELDPRVAVVVAEGELDAYTVPDLAATFDRVSDRQRVVADLQAVSFMDSMALRVVVRALREVAERGGTSKLVLPRGSARRIFEITTLDRALPVSESRAAALLELA